ncbi:MAG: hypothetical protein WC618_05180 [Patescibacteria group bacterium]
MTLGVSMATLKSKMLFQNADVDLGLGMLFPEQEEDQERIDQGTWDVYGSYRVTNFGEVDLYADQHRYMGYILPVEIIELMSADDATDVANLETWNPLDGWLWHEELCEVQDVINAWANNSELDYGCAVCQNMLERLHRVAGPAPKSKPTWRRKSERPILVWHSPEFAVTA